MAVIKGNDAQSPRLMGSRTEIIQVILRFLLSVHKLETLAGGVVRRMIGRFKLWKSKDDKSHVGESSVILINQVVSSFLFPTSVSLCLPLLSLISTGLRFVFQLISITKKKNQFHDHVNVMQASITVIIRVKLSM